MTIRILADREPYASYASSHLSGQSKDPSGSFVISAGKLSDEDPPPDLIAMPVEDFLAMPPERRMGCAIFAYGGVSEMAEAFALGCTDYLREPWSLRELTARASKLEKLRIPFGDVELSLTRDRLVSPSASVRLTEPERRIARVLIRNAGYAVTKEAIAYALWGQHPFDVHTIESYVSSLRAKLKQVDTAADITLHAVRGLGYRLTKRICG